MSAPAKGTPRADDMCTQCGHPFNSHRLLGYGSPPTEGWMECPIQGCDCKMTWSLEPEVASQIKAKGEPHA
jgi:hypothetical protein